MRAPARLVIAAAVLLSAALTGRTHGNPAPERPGALASGRAAGTESPGVGALASYSRETFPVGTSKAKVIIYSTPTAAPKSSRAAVDAVMAEVEALYARWSGGRFVLTHEIEEVAAPSFTCSGILKQAPAGFDHVIEYGPVPGATCGWAGLGTLGGDWLIVVNDAFSTQVVAHELGHNLGLSHAGSVNCADAQTAWDNCTWSEYGDPVNVMGGGTNDLGAIGMSSLDWLDPSQVRVDIQGETDLAPLPAAIVLSDPKGGGEYWVEYTRKLTTPRIPADQILVRRVSTAEGRSSRSALLDRGTAKSWPFNGGFVAGDTFVDPTGLLRVEVLSLGETARLRISGIPRPAIAAWPVSVSSATSKDVSLDIEPPANGNRAQAIEMTVWYTDGAVTTTRYRPYSQWVSVPRPKYVAAVRVAVREPDGAGPVTNLVLKDNPWVPRVASAKAVTDGVRISIANPQAHNRMRITCSASGGVRVFESPAASTLVRGTGQLGDCTAELQTLTAGVVTATESIPLPRPKGATVSIDARQTARGTRIEVVRKCTCYDRATVTVEKWNGTKWARAKKISLSGYYWNWTTKTKAEKWRVRVNRTTYTPVYPEG